MDKIKGYPDKIIWQYVSKFTPIKTKPKTYLKNIVSFLLNKNIDIKIIVKNNRPAIVRSRKMSELIDMSGEYLTEPEKSRYRTYAKDDIEISKLIASGNTVGREEMGIP